MEDLFPEELVAKIRKAPVIAVLVIDRAEDAVPLARALLRGGVTAVELTLRTPAALDAVDKIKSEVPEMLIGIGTILNPEQARAAKQRGAAFGVAPGMNPQVIAAAKEAGLSFAPGIMTPSEIEAAYAQGCPVMKLFPAEPAGGLGYLNSINAPYQHLGIQYIPLGGVSQENLKLWLENEHILGIGGSWLAPRKLIQEKAWDTISRNCEKASETAARVRG
jgi:2-dehydro-3-deoxyphosphogluconate aldolase/(4S)-4-hydroxy-2-oxoglutarate aldolase